MKNEKGDVLFEGQITKKCIQFVRRFDDPHMDLSGLATRVEYRYQPHSTMTKEEENLLVLLNACDYDCFGMDDSFVVWTIW